MEAATDELRRSRRARLHGDDGVHERRKLALEPREQRREERLACPRFVLVGERVVDGEPHLGALGLPDLTRELHHVQEVR